MEGLCMYPPADPFQWSQHCQERLRLTHPSCRAWVEHVNALLAQRLPPERAQFWWLRLHIDLRNRSPLWLLPEGWTPDSPEACVLEVYAHRYVHMHPRAAMATEPTAPVPHPSGQSDG